MSPFDELRQRNLETFRLRLPHIHARLLEITEPMTRPVIEDGAIIDMDLGTGRFYKEDGRALARKQVAAFIETPRRVGYRITTALSGDSPLSQRLFLHLVASVKAHYPKDLPEAPVTRSGFLLVFGLGLGYHLPALAAGLEVDCFIVAETIDEFVLQSLSTIDWTALFALCDARGTKFSLVLSHSPDQLCSDIQGMFDVQGELAIDGSYYYRHYPSPVLDRAFESVVNDVPLLMIQRGYYEDERKMLWNTITNLEKYDSQILTGTFKLPIEVPAFLVTSGPSVDYDVEMIKKWRDHAIIFSGGSSLQVLLANGIIPDYHVELENVVQVWDFLEHILELNQDKFPDGHFTGIKLIASVTVNPRVTPLFDETYYFFRDSVSSSASFAGDIKVLSPVGPNVANTVLSVAARMGFRHVYLFGMDSGWRDGEAHHSKNTAYYTHETFKTGTQKGTYTFPGNFGGTIQSTMLLGWTRDMLEDMVHRMGLRAYNCSDGALIKWATPKLSETLDFPGSPLNREKIYERVRTDAVPMPKGSHLAQFDFDIFIREIDAFEATIEALCDEALEEDKQFSWMQRQLTEIHRTYTTSPWSHVYAVFQGATIGLAKCGCIFLNRIDDEQACREVFKDFISEYRQVHREMAAETRAIYADAKAWIAGGPEPSWTAGLLTTPGYTF